MSKYARTERTERTERTVTEWRKKKPNKSKRVAYGCKIETKNIIHGTRTRRDFNYKYGKEDYSSLEDDEQENIQVNNYIYPIQERSRPRRSQNTTESRLKIFDPSDPKSVREMKEKLRRKNRRNKKSEDGEYKGRRRGRKPKRKEKKEEEEEEEMEDVEEKVEEKMEDVEEKVEKKEILAPVVKSRRKSAKPGLAKESLEILKKLGATFSKTKQRTYKGTPIPVAIQNFLDHKFPENTVLNNEPQKVFNVTCEGEFLLKSEEMKEFKWLRENKDAILISDGDSIVCAKLSDKKKDFSMYFLDDDEPSQVRGPISISKFLKDTTLGEAPEEEEEEDSMKE